MTALVRLAEAEGFPRHCWQLARASWFAQFEGGHLDELIETHVVGLRVAEALGDEVAVAMMLNYLASAHYRLGRFAESNRLMERALDVYRRLGLRAMCAIPWVTWATRTSPVVTIAGVGSAWRHPRHWPGGCRSRSHWPTP